MWYGMGMGWGIDNGRGKVHLGTLYLYVRCVLVVQLWKWERDIRRDQLQSEGRVLQSKARQSGTYDSPEQGFQI